MTHEEQRRFLIQALLDEEPEYKTTAIPDDEQDQKNLLRALMNVRPARPISPDFLQVQDAYLSDLVQEAGIVDAAALPALADDPRLVLWQGDITRLKIDAIINPANSGLTGCYRPLHNCLDNIIHSKAGIQLRLTCNQIMEAQGHEEPTGQAKITPAYNLPCRYVIHTVGPIVLGPLTQKHKDQLASCYRSCLTLAADQGLRSIACCCISTGVFRFPNDEAAQIAVATVRDFLASDDRLERVVFNVFKDIDLALYRDILGA